MAGARKQKGKSELDSLLQEMWYLQEEIKQREVRYERLKQQVFPLVEAAGDVYQTEEGVKAQIIRGQTWQVDVPQLIEKFGQKAYNLLSISASRFRKACELGLLGSESDLFGIAQLKDQTPQFRLSK